MTAPKLLERVDRLTTSNEEWEDLRGPRYGTPKRKRL